eukprot:s4587_g8.t1
MVKSPEQLRVLQDAMADLHSSFDPFGFTTLTSTCGGGDFTGAPSGALAAEAEAALKESSNGKQSSCAISCVMTLFIDVSGYRLAADDQLQAWEWCGLNANGCSGVGMLLVLLDAALVLGLKCPNLSLSVGSCNTIHGEQRFLLRCASDDAVWNDMQRASCGALLIAPEVHYG